MCLRKSFAGDALGLCSITRSNRLALLHPPSRSRRVPSLSSLGYPHPRPHPLTFWTCPTFLPSDPLKDNTHHLSPLRTGLQPQPCPVPSTAQTVLFSLLCRPREFHTSVKRIRDFAAGVTLRPAVAMGRARGARGARRRSGRKGGWDSAMRGTYYLPHGLGVGGVEYECELLLRYDCSCSVVLCLWACSSPGVIRIEDGAGGES